MNRSDALNAIRFAGYHGDKSTFTSLYIENRVSRQAAEAAFRQGAQAKKAGQRCTCMDCREANPAPLRCRHCGQLVGANSKGALRGLMLDLHKRPDGTHCPGSMSAGEGAESLPSDDNARE